MLIDKSIALRWGQKQYTSPWKTGSIEVQRKGNSNVYTRIHWCQIQCISTVCLHCDNRTECSLPAGDMHSIIPDMITNKLVQTFSYDHKCPLCVCFYAPGLKGPPGASSNRIVRPSVLLFVCLFVCPSVRNSVPLTNKVQYLKFEWWYSNQTWTVSSSMGSSHFTDISCPWGGAGSKYRT